MLAGMLQEIRLGESPSVLKELRGQPIAMVSFAIGIVHCSSPRHSHILADQNHNNSAR
jgi:hypothetical protein